MIQIEIKNSESSADAAGVHDTGPSDMKGDGAPEKHLKSQWNVRGTDTTITCV